MRRAAPLVLALNLLLAHDSAPQTQGFVTLAGLRGIACPLLIFAPKPDDPQLEIQLRTLEEHPAETHNLTLVPIGIPYQNPSPTAARLTATDAESLRRRFNVAPADFALILLGKDGIQLLRSTKPLSMHRLEAAAAPQPQPPSNSTH
jgi:hypothetical protein